MNTKNFIQVFEHQKLRYSDSGVFRRHHFDAMVKFNELHQNKYFTPIHNGICFGSYVGVIQIGGLTIEILPKADNSTSPDANLWQNASEQKSSLSELFRPSHLPYKAKIRKILDFSYYFLFPLFSLLSPSWGHAHLVFKKPL